MKVSAIVAALATSQAVAFVPSQGAFVRTTTSIASKETTRGDFLLQFGGIVGSVITMPGAVNAAQYFGVGAGPSNVIDPKDAIIDEDVLKSDSVQKSIKSLTDYLSGVRSMQDALKSNSQTDVGPFLRKEFDFVKLRADLNTLNSAFDEDTQKGTDRLIRNIMQDITEIETANRQKEGIPRSDRRLEIMNGKLEKLACAFEDFLAFSK